MTIAQFIGFLLMLGSFITLIVLAFKNDWVGEWINNIVGLFVMIIIPIFSNMKIAVMTLLSLLVFGFLLVVW